MKVCFFGSYVLDAYTPLLKKILKLQGIEVIECHEEISKVSSFIPAYFRLFLKHRKLKYDVMIIPWQGIITLPLAKLISKKPIVYYAAISVYDTLVIDRRIIKPNSIKAKFTHVIDKLACQWSDMVYTESFAYIKYFVNEFGLDKNKFRRLFLSADETIYQSIPYKEPTQEFKVLYFGTFIPLHGTDTIVEAAKILSKYKDIVFIFSGTGQEKTLVENLAKKYHLSNVKFLGFVEKSIYLKNITEADVCLGIFGKSSKSKNVVTNKVTQILASQKPLITMDSEAIREITAENEKNCILVPPNDPKKLADAILFLKNNPHKRESIAKAGRELYVKNLSLEKTGKLLVSYLMELVNEKRLSLYSLTTSYVKSSKKGVGSFIHDLNKELISLGVIVKVITPHSKGEKLKEVVDGVKIIRFKYSPENFEINYSAISDEVSKSRKGLFKVFLMTGGFFLNSFLECLKER